MILIETLPKNIIDAFYSAFRNSAPVRFLIKIKDEKKLPPGLPKNVKLFSWLPQIQVLSMFTYNMHTQLNVIEYNNLFKKCNIIRPY